MRMQLLAAHSHPWMQGMIVAYDGFLAAYMSLLVPSGLFMVAVAGSRRTRMCACGRCASTAS